MNRSRFSPLYEAPRPGYMFHMDIAGPFRISTSGGCRYLAVLVDDYSRRVFLFLLKLLSDFFETFKAFNRRLQSEFGRDRVIAQILSDSASYFESSHVMRDYCRQQGIFQLFSPPYTQELNGVAERTIRSVVTMARSMLLAAHAPPFLFGDSRLSYTLVICSTNSHTELELTLQNLAFDAGIPLQLNSRFALSAYGAVRPGL